jgi:conjugative transposon TraJ protein
MNKTFFLGGVSALTLLCPIFSYAQVPNGVQYLHNVLENVYNQMIPLVSQILTIARGIAGFAATFYIGYRVWRHIANAEPVDFFPLFRPFVLTLLIGIFPKVLGVINGVLKPTVTVTTAIVKNSNDAIWGLLAEREAAIKQSKEWQIMFGSVLGDQGEWYKYTHNGKTEGVLQAIPDAVSFQFSRIWYGLKYFMKYLISVILEILYYAASLCIDTIRTFHLIVLAILGPFVFAMACFDGFQQSLIQWLARYINIYLWLPVANIFGAILAEIEKNMLKIDIGQIISTGNTTFTATDTAYLIFMVIGILGYFTVPGVANYIVHAHTINPILNKVNSVTSLSSRAIFSGSGGGGGGEISSGDLHNNPRNTSDGSWGDKTASSNFQQNKISG